MKFLILALNESVENKNHNRYNYENKPALKGAGFCKSIVG